MLHHIQPELKRILFCVMRELIDETLVSEWVRRVVHCTPIGDGYVPFPKYAFHHKIWYLVLGGNAAHDLTASLHAAASLVSNFLCNHFVFKGGNLTIICQYTTANVQATRPIRSLCYILLTGPYNFYGRPALF